MVAPEASSQAPSAPDTPMAATAGMVVTEINTPTNAPALASVSDNVPATPASSATTPESTDGFTMIGRVLEESDRGDEGGDDEEHEEADGQHRLVTHLRVDLFPHRGIRPVAGHAPFGGVGGLAHHDVDVLEGDRTLPVHADRPQPRDDGVHALAHHVGQNEIAGRIEGGAAKDDEVAGRRIGADQVHNVLGARRGRHDA